MSRKLGVGRLIQSGLVGCEWRGNRNYILVVSTWGFLISALLEVSIVIAHDSRTPFLLCLYIFLDSFTFKTPHSFISHLISRHQDCIRLLKEIDKDKMGIYKGINHALHLCLESHGFSELGIRRPPKDVIP